MDRFRAFLGMEENADGAAPANDRAVLKAAFDKFDADKSGKLSGEECQALMKSQLGTDDGSFAKRLEAKLNEEQEHELDFDQFLTVYNQVHGWHATMVGTPLPEPSAEAHQICFAGPASDVIGAVNSLAMYSSSAAKRAELQRRLVVLRTTHISAALFSANFDGGDEVQHHVSAVKGLLDAGAHLVTTPSAFAAAFGTLTQAHDALVLLKRRYQQRGAPLLKRMRKRIFTRASQRCKNLSRSRRNF